MTKMLLDSGAVLRLESAITQAVELGNISVYIGITDAKAILASIQQRPTPPASNPFGKSLLEHARSWRAAGFSVD